MSRIHSCCIFSLAFCLSSIRALWESVEGRRGGFLPTFSHSSHGFLLVGVSSRSCHTQTSFSWNFRREAFETRQWRKQDDNRESTCSQFEAQSFFFSGAVWEPFKKSQKTGGAGQLFLWLGEVWALLVLQAPQKFTNGDERSVGRQRRSRNL